MFLDHKAFSSIVGDSRHLQFWKGQGGLGLSFLRHEEPETQHDFSHQGSFQPKKSKIENMQFETRNISHVRACSLCELDVKIKCDLDKDKR